MGRARQIFAAYFLPGLVFQSIIVAGGYGTGQELLVFFLRFGPLAGLLGMILVSVPVISLSAMVAYEFARVFRAYDYRTFFRQLLGRAWFVWEVGFLFTAVVFFGIITAAASEIVSGTFGLPRAAGGLGLLLLVGFLVFQGSNLIKNAFASWSMVLYVTYATFFVWALWRFGDVLRDLDPGPLDTPWATSGLRHGFLQLSMLPVMLFTLRDVHTRRQAVGAGLLTGPIALIPGLFFYFAMLTHYPAVLSAVVPTNYMLESLDVRWFHIAFQVVLLGTLVETGTGLVHAFNERLSSWYESRNRHMPRPARPVAAVVLFFLAWSMSKAGLLALVQLAFDVVGWIYMTLLVVPLFTIGLYRLWRQRQMAVASRFPG